jgi:filamentous hemagglutinin family protein
MRYIFLILTSFIFALPKLDVEKIPTNAKLDYSDDKLDIVGNGPVSQVYFSHFNVAKPEAVNYLLPKDGICINYVENSSTVQGTLNSNKGKVIFIGKDITFSKDSQINIKDLEVYADKIHLQGHGLFTNLHLKGHEVNVMASLKAHRIKIDGNKVRIKGISKTNPLDSSVKNNFFDIKTDFFTVIGKTIILDNLFLESKQQEIGIKKYSDVLVTNSKLISSNAGRINFNGETVKILKSKVRGYNGEVGIYSTAMPVTASSSILAPNGHYIYDPTLLLFDNDNLAALQNMRAQLQVGDYTIECDDLEISADYKLSWDSETTLTINATNTSLRPGFSIDTQKGNLTVSNKNSIVFCQSLEKEFQTYF